ncbi:MAG: peptidase MA family metallohydrolase [Anaerolineales bacterium]
MKASIRFALLLAFLFLGSANSASAQSPVEIVDQQVEYLFNERLHFTVHFQSSENLQEGFVFYQFEGSERNWVYEGDLGEDQTLDILVGLVAENSPPPFTEIEYWYRFATDHGDIYESPHYILHYDDNRYAWQSLESAPYILYWHSGDAAFAESVLAAARSGASRTQQLLSLPDLDSAVLRIYSDAQDVQLISQQAGFNWQAGHTDPDAGVILLSLAPGQSLEIQRQVPHEIAHLMLYNSLGAEVYSHLPTWLNEGIASYAEVYSDPVQGEYLELANAGDTLIPFFSLCNSFPQDSASARLAYAQSASFVRFLFNTYKAAGFSLFVDAYAKTDDCINAPFEAFGKDLIALDAEWRAATFVPQGDAPDWLVALPWMPILSSAAVALGLFLLLRFVASRRS